MSNADTKSAPVIPYTPPLRDMKFLLREVFGAEVDEDVLGGAAEFASGVLAPLNGVGDVYGATLEGGDVKTAPGFKDAYVQFWQSGWNAAPFAEEEGGFGLSQVNFFALAEMEQAANPAFSLCPMLTQAAARAVKNFGTPKQKELYFSKLVSGEWTGTMVLTESQAGSYLPAITTKAIPQDDGTYTIEGLKTFITWGTHDMADNIIHMVLAKLPDSDDISMFIVPKILKDGTPNNIQCMGLEDKMGIHGSPTCTLAFNEARGFLLGEANKGLQQMFTMMNEARLQVGIQGVGVADRTWQAALRYAQQREQGVNPMTGKLAKIVEHADVKRMLLSAKAQTEAARALAYSTAVFLDQAEAGDEEAKKYVDLLTPIVKAWCTDVGCEVTDSAIEILGGYGFMKEYGVEQFARDARIFRIYEGTNGIQAADLAGRKVTKDRGEAARKYIEKMRSMIAENDRAAFAPYLSRLQEATQKLAELGDTKNKELIGAISRPFLKAFGTIAGATLLSLSAAKAAEGSNPKFAAEKEITAQFYLRNILPKAMADLEAALDGSEIVADPGTDFLATYDHAA